MSLLPTGWDREIRPDAPEEQLAAAISSSGLNPTKSLRIVLDGNIHRFAVEGDKGRETAGWYVGFGDNIPAGMFGSWRGGFEQRWRADIGRELSPEELAAYEARIAEAIAIKEGVTALAINAVDLITKDIPKDDLHIFINVLSEMAENMNEEVNLLKIGEK